MPEPLRPYAYNPIHTPDSFLAAQVAFLTTDEAQASYGFARPPAPVLVDDSAALLARAEKAEARVREMQQELSEQEVDKLSLLRELRQCRASLHNATR